MKMEKHSKKLLRKAYEAGIGCDLLIDKEKQFEKFYNSLWETPFSLWLKENNFFKSGRKLYEHKFLEGTFTRYHLNQEFKKGGGLYSPISEKSGNNGI